MNESSDCSSQGHKGQVRFTWRPPFVISLSAAVVAVATMCLCVSLITIRSAVSQSGSQFPTQSSHSYGGLEREKGRTDGRTDGRNCSSSRDCWTDSSSSHLPPSVTALSRFNSLYQRNYREGTYVGLHLMT